MIDCFDDFIIRMYWNVKDTYKLFILETPYRKPHSFRVDVTGYILHSIGHAPVPGTGSIIFGTAPPESVTANQLTVLKSLAARKSRKAEIICTIPV